MINDQKDGDLFQINDIPNPLNVYGKSKLKGDTTY